jgi:hypothetical protein
VRTTGSHAILDDLAASGLDKPLELNPGGGLPTANNYTRLRIAMPWRERTLFGYECADGGESSGRVKQRRSCRSVLSLLCLLTLIPCAALDGGSGVQRIEVL